MNEFGNILLLFSILQLFLVGLILIFIKSGNTIANRFLSLFLISKAICFWGGLSWSFGGKEMSLLFFAMNSFSFDLLLGPSLYFYIKKSTFNEVKFDKYFYYNFIPFIVLFIANCIICITDIEFLKVNIFMYKIFNLFPVLEFIVFFIYSQFVVYSILSIKLLSNYTDYLTGNYSEVHVNLLRWLRVLLGGFVFIWMMNIAAIFFSTGNIIGAFISTITIAGIFLFANLIVIITIRFPEIFQNKIPVVKRKYEKNLIDESEKALYLDRLKKLMDEEKLYLSSTLGLTDLAEKLKTQNHVLSQIINSGFGKNFYDFVNSYRVEECKKMLGSPSGKSKTILEIAFECGFNSKSVFNDSFKKNTGLTPSDFRKQIVLD